MVLILGGGVSGLSAAHYALKYKLFPASAINLLEASPQVGGWIKSTVRPNNVIYEHGPRTIRPKGKQGVNTLVLVEELGLSDKVKPIPMGHPATMNRLVYVDKQLHKLPSSLTSVFLKKKPFDKPLVFAAVTDLRAPRKVCADESIYDFVARRFGKDIAEYAISPLICGICAGDSKEVSVKFLMRSLFEAEQSHGSVIKGMISDMFSSKKKEKILQSELAMLAAKEKWNVWSLEGGLQLLPKTLESTLRNSGVSVHLNSPCQSLTFVDDKVVVRTENGEFISKHAISALPSCVLGPLLQSQHPELGNELCNIPYVTVGVVNLKFPTSVLKEQGFGFLVPPSQKLPILGVVYDSCCFPPNEDSTVLTVMMGGRFLEQHFGKLLRPDVALQTAVKYAKEILDIKVDPIDHNTSILENCIPQYVVGHDERLRKIYGYIKKNKLPLTLVGSSYEGVGVNDVILSSHKGILRIKTNVRT